VKCLIAGWTSGLPALSIIALGPQLNLHFPLSNRCFVYVLRWIKDPAQFYNFHSLKHLERLRFSFNLTKPIFLQQFQAVFFFRSKICFYSPKDPKTFPPRSKESSVVTWRKSVGSSSVTSQNTLILRKPIFTHLVTKFPASHGKRS